MFFILSKVLAFLTMPLTLVTVCLVISFIFKKKKFAAKLNSLGILLLLLFTNPFLCSMAMRWWEIPPREYDSIESDTYTIGVVLTGMLDLDALPDDRIHFNSSVDRINHAIELYQRGIIKKILISGGSGSIMEKEIKEAPKLQKYSITFGVNPADIIVEDASRNTYENAKFTMQMIRNLESDPRPFLLITSAYHMRRSQACFAKQQGNFVSFSTDYQTREMKWTPDHLILPSLDAMRWWHVLFKEWMGIFAYKMAGYI